eukprot:s299_g27.t1
MVVNSDQPHSSKSMAKTLMPPPKYVPVKKKVADTPDQEQVVTPPDQVGDTPEQEQVVTPPDQANDQAHVLGKFLEEYVREHRLEALEVRPPPA